MLTLRSLALATSLPLTTLTALAACGGSNGNVSPRDAGADGTSSGDSGIPSPDGGIVSPDGALASPDGATAADAEAGVPWGPPSGPACTPACTGGQVCIGGSCACPIYQTLCGGQCIPTVDDPSHCGSCTTTCSTGQVCSAGQCASTCPTGLTACGGQCVDTKTDDSNCGNCNAPCGAGLGCIWGTCGPATVKTSSSCDSGGPIPSVTVGGQTYCLDQLGTASFLQWGVCSCKNFATDENQALVDAYDSRQGPYTAGSTPGGAVGVDGYVNVNNPMSVSGALWVAGAQGGGGIVSRGLTVGGDLHISAGPDAGLHSSIEASGSVAVQGNGYATTGIQTGETFAITGALHQPAGSTNASGVTYGSLVPGPVQVPSPCACDAGSAVPIASLVTMAQANNDDNAVGLNPAALDGSSGNQVARLDLPCGSYYLTTIAENNPVVVYAHGRVALYIGGDVDSQVAFGLDPTAELDVFIGGQLNINQPVVFGSPSYPSLVRVFVGGTVDVDSTLDVSGYLYAPNALYNLNDTTTVYGGLFVADFSARDVFVHYDRALLAPGPSCTGQ